MDVELLARFTQALQSSTVTAPTPSILANGMDVSLSLSRLQCPTVPLSILLEKEYASLLGNKFAGLHLSLLPLHQRCHSNSSETDAALHLLSLAGQTESIERTQAQCGSVAVPSTLLFESKLGCRLLNAPSALLSKFSEDAALPRIRPPPTLDATDSASSTRLMHKATPQRMHVSSQAGARPQPDVSELIKVLNDDGSSSCSEKLQSRGIRRTKREQFPERLHRILLEQEEEGHGDIVSFTSDGTAFEIHLPAKFEEKILPRYFRQGGGIASFKKQLHLYDFKRLKASGRGSSMIYHHPNFQKGRPDSCLLMNRVNKNVGQARALKSCGYLLSR